MATFTEVKNPKTVFACFTGDRSGSMQTMGDAHAEGFHGWVKGLQSACKENGQQGFVSASFFDDVVERPLENVDLATLTVTMLDAQKWTEPRGSTRLYDTAIEDLERLRTNVSTYQDEQEKETGQRPEVTMIWALFTDGFHNVGSKTAADLKAAVEAGKEKGVDCFFLAANQDAVQQGERYGFIPGCSLTTGNLPEDCSQGLQALTQNMLASVSGETLQFTEAQRQRSAPTTLGRNRAMSPPPIFGMEPPVAQRQYTQMLPTVD